ncbi:hypothetical protein HYS28_00885 [Candidatus Uhrbacteria bacterium]|nr:hypothetical protein [Candidatus Uhrbacteria bacterium]
MHTRLWKTLFFTALLAYCVFGVIEYAAPGFVSNVFSVHLLALVAFVAAIGWMGSHPTIHRPSSTFLGTLLAITLGIVLAVVLWREGEPFGDLRLPLALAGLVLPWCARKALSEHESSR